MALLMVKSAATGKAATKNNFRAVLFDLDMTLIDFMRMKKACCSAAITAMIDSGLKLDRKKAKDILFKLYDTYGIEYQQIFQKFLQRTLGKVDYKILANAITAYRRTQAGFLHPYPHVRSTLLRLRERGIKLGVVSDAPKLKAWLRLAEMGLTDFFDVVVALDDTGELKPSRMPFRAALKKIRAKPEEVLFVGDNPERDIKGAKKVGMRTALAKYGQIPGAAGSGKGAAKADFELQDVSDLLSFV